MLVMKKGSNLPVSCHLWKERFTWPGTMLGNNWIDLLYKEWYSTEFFLSLFKYDYKIYYDLGLYFKY